MTIKTVALRGSNRRPLSNAKPIGPAPRDERLEVTFHLRPRTPLPTARMLASAAPRPILTRDEFEKRYGASRSDIRKVREFAKAHNLVVVRESRSRRSVMLGGTVDEFDKAFGIQLKIYDYPRGTYRGRIGTIKVPKSLARCVEGIFGLDNRPVAKRRSGPFVAAAPATGGAQSFDPNQIAALYNFPPDADGAGQTIGVIELGGGYQPQDLANYFAALHIPAPSVVRVLVDHAGNSSTTAASTNDQEVALDLEVVGAVAPGAKFVVYFAPNTAQGFLDAIKKAIHDTEQNCSVISVSWCLSELALQQDSSSRTIDFLTNFDKALQDAASLGVTVCVASGDNGAAGLPPDQWDGRLQVGFPASSPFALACGGTRMALTGGAIVDETVWNHRGQGETFESGGGGVSAAFALPQYQSGAGVPALAGGKTGRGVPDVAGNADFDCGYNILVDGVRMIRGGTSAVAPLWAGLIGRINQKLGGRVGWINPQIYALSPGSGAFRDIVNGDNRCAGRGQNLGYDARPGWDPCTGLGTPNGVTLCSLLKAMPRPTARS
jgi:kumamolisin